MNKRIRFVMLTAVLALLGSLVMIHRTESASALFQRRPDPQEQLGWQSDTLLPVSAGIGSLPAVSPAGEAETEDGRLLLNAFQSSRFYQILGASEISGKEAAQRIRITTLDTDKLGMGLSDMLQNAMRQKVEAASRPEEIYRDGKFKPELVAAAFHELWLARLSDELPMADTELTLSLRYEDGGWQLINSAELEGALLRGVESGARADEIAHAIYEETAAALRYIPMRYTIPEDALAGPVPDLDKFGVTDDPAVIEALLQRPEAQALIGGQELVWNADIERFPGTPIRYYLDDSILALVWQEVEAREVGTFAEVFIADGSQLRRKISGDELWSFDFATTSDFAKRANAVLAVGGDFYYHGRNCGIGIYQRELYRFEPNSCDVCYITADGDMLFSYRGQYQSEDEVMRFVRENDVLFSLVFGPVLIDNGVDMTPDSYAWGEISDEYARSALGMMGERHYLTMNLNCGEGQYYYLATLRQAADAMIRRGCVKAYTLDGGQTATTVFNGELINPVQFGWEKGISDILYFATAIPNG